MRTAREAPGSRSTIRAVALPSEHGGWGLTAEPVLLGLLVAPGWAGACLGAAALVAFLARTPLKVLLVDAFRGRVTERAAVARRVLAAEVVALALLVVGAALLADGAFWWPALVALPLVGVELWFDMRSRGRRLVPELAGSVGIASVVAMVVLADGGAAGLAVSLWLVLAARSVTAIPQVRVRIARLHHREPDRAAALLGDGAAVVLAGTAAWVSPEVTAGAAAVMAVVVLQRLSAARPVASAKVLGAQQSALGVAVVAVTAVGVHLW